MSTVYTVGISSLLGGSMFKCKGCREPFLTYKEVEDHINQEHIFKFFYDNIVGHTADPRKVDVYGIEHEVDLH